MKRSYAQTHLNFITFIDDSIVSDWDFLKAFTT